MCAFEQADGQFVVVGHVELEKASGAVPGTLNLGRVGTHCTFVIGRGDIFDRRTARRAQSIHEAQLACDFCNRQLALGMVDLVDSDRGEPDGCSAFMSKQRGGCVTVVGVDELGGDDTVAEEGLTVCEVGVREAGVAFGVRPTTTRQMLPRLLLQFPGFCGVVLAVAAEVNEGGAGGRRHKGRVWCARDDG